MSLRTQLSVVSLLVLLSATLASARNAPNPLPNYSSLEGRADRVAYLTTDLIGTKVLLGQNQDLEFYVWDIGLAIDPDGGVIFLHWELQSATDYIDRDRILSELPAGSVEVSDLRDAFTAGNIIYTDGDGIVRMITASAVDKGAIGPGGTINAPGLGGGSTCRSTGWLGVCSGLCYGGCSQSCWCGTGDYNTCEFRATSPTCSGTCGTGRTCQHDNAMGCGCS